MVWVSASCSTGNFIGASEAAAPNPTPDTTQASLYKDLESGIAQGATLLFAHGFNIHYGEIKPREDLDVVLIAPKGPGY